MSIFEQRLSFLMQNAGGCRKVPYALQWVHGRTLVGGSWGKAS